MIVITIFLFLFWLLTRLLISFSLNQMLTETDMRLPDSPGN